MIFIVTLFKNYIIYYRLIYENLFWMEAFNILQSKSKSTLMLKNLIGRNTKVKVSNIKNSKARIELKEYNAAEFCFEPPQKMKYLLENKLTKNNKIAFIIISPNAKYNDYSREKCHCSLGIIEKSRNNTNKHKNNLRLKVA